MDVKVTPYCGFIPGTFQQIVKIYWEASKKPNKEMLENSMFFIKALPLSPDMNVSTFIYQKAAVLISNISCRSMPWTSNLREFSILIMWTFCFAPTTCHAKSTLANSILSSNKLWCRDSSKCSNKPTMRKYKKRTRLCLKRNKWGVKADQKPISHRLISLRSLS